MPSQARRRWCDKPANLEGKVLGTDLVFTWVQYQVSGVRGTWGATQGLTVLGAVPSLFCRVLLR
jgi:hypothetical protein